jgi:HSP20 family protein
MGGGRGAEAVEAMARQRPNPFRGFFDVLVELERMRQVGRSGAEPEGEDRPRTHATAWVPAADIFANGPDLVIHLDLPSVRPDDIVVTFDGGVLTVSGERPPAVPDTASYYVRERYYGTFKRSMILPDGVDQSQISASFADGVAEIVVAGAARFGEPRRIPVEDRSSGQVTRVNTSGKRGMVG